MSAAHPILRWAGSKRRLLPTLLAHLPSGFDRYLEPFCGGAAMFFAIASRDGLSASQWDGRAILGDLNVELVECYSALVHDVDAVLAVAKVHALAHEADPRGHYNEVRAMFNDTIGELSIHERAAAFLYLNAACYNGLWRVNSSGGFNVPVGDRTHIRFDEDNLRAAAKVLGGARLIAGDYRATMRLACAGDLVVCDPPYDGTFDAYSSRGFSQDDQRDLAADVVALARRGVRVMLTNAATDLVRELYRDFRVVDILGPRSISCDGDRKPAKELLVTTYSIAAEASHGNWYRDNLSLPGVS